MVAAVSRIPTTIITNPDGSKKPSYSQGIAVVGEQTKDRQTNDIQATAARASASMRAHPHGDGLTILQDVQFATGTVQDVQHGLGRPYRGWMAVRQRNDDGNVRELPNTNPALDAHQIRLVATGNILTDLWIW